MTPLKRLAEGSTAVLEISIVFVSNFYYKYYYFYFYLIWLTDLPDWLSHCPECTMFFEENWLIDPRTRSHETRCWTIGHWLWCCTSGWLNNRLSTSTWNVGSRHRECECDYSKHFFQDFWQEYVSPRAAQGLVFVQRGCYCPNLWSPCIQLCKWRQWTRECDSLVCGRRQYKHCYADLDPWLPIQ